MATAPSSLPACVNARPLLALQKTHACSLKVWPLDPRGECSFHLTPKKAELVLLPISHLGTVSHIEPAVRYVLLVLKYLPKRVAKDMASFCTSVLGYGVSCYRCFLPPPSSSSEARLSLLSHMTSSVAEDVGGSSDRDAAPCSTQGNLGTPLILLGTSTPSLFLTSVQKRMSGQTSVEQSWSCY